MNAITSMPAGPADFHKVRCIRGFEAIKDRFKTYLSDESRLSPGRVDYLFFPQDEAELAAVLREMRKRRVPVTLSAARTGIAGGCVPPAGALVSLERFNTVTDLRFDRSAREWRVTARCSVRLQDLETQVRQKRFPDLEKTAAPALKARLEQFRADPEPYFYPPDPTEMSASIGGTVATNASGARTYRYGPTRSWVRRMRVMLASGEILNIARGQVSASPAGEYLVSDSKGRTSLVRLPNYRMPSTKNTSGLATGPNMDLVDLFVGSEGILGIVTEVEVALLAKQPKISIVQFFASDDRAIDFVVALRGEQRIRPDFIEFYSRRAMDLLRDRQQADPRSVGMPPIPGDPAAAVFYEMTFAPDDADPDDAVFETLAGGCGTTLERSWAGHEPADLKRFKAFRHLLPETVNAIIAERKREMPRLHKLGTDFAVPFNRLREMWRVYQATLDAAGLEWVAFGHIGDSHLHINILPNSPAELEKGLRLYEQFARKAVALGGVVSAEHGIGKIKARYLSLMFSDREIDQMRQVKAALDPDLILNPGNVLECEGEAV